MFVVMSTPAGPPQSLTRFSAAPRQQIQIALTKLNEDAEFERVLEARRSQLGGPGASSGGFAEGKGLLRLTSETSLFRLARGHCVCLRSWLSVSEA
jgi:hypothetical protein